MDCSPPGSSIHEDSPVKNIGAGCHALLQGIFPTQGSNPGLSHCRWILYHLSHQGSPRILEVGSLSILQGNFLTQESKQGLLHCRRTLYQWSYQGSPHFSVPEPKCLLFLLFLRQSHFHIYSLQRENNKGQSHLMTHIYKALLQPKHASLQDAGGWQLSIPADSLPSRFKYIYSACYCLLQAVFTIEEVLEQRKGEDEAAWFGGAKFGRVLWAMKLELQS